MANPVSPKVVATTATAFVLWLLATYVFKSDVPQAVAAVVGVAVTFAVGYLVPDPQRRTTPPQG